jgi:hypothetical protein
VLPSSHPFGLSRACKSNLVCGRLTRKSDITGGLFIATASSNLLSSLRNLYTITCLIHDAVDQQDNAELCGAEEGASAASQALALSLGVRSSRKR